VGTVLAEAGGCGIDDARIAFLHHPIVETEPLGRAEPHIVDKDIRRFDQLKERLSCRRSLQVEGDALLVAVNVEKVSAHAGMARRAERSNWITLRRLDLDHIRPHVAEELRRQRSQ